jgi:epoxyqueuosine reductase
VIDAEPIKNFGRQIGIEIRITRAQPLIPEARRMQIQSRAGFFLNPASWTKKSINEFCDLKSILPDARTVITAALDYLTPDEPDPSRPGLPYGLVARYTRRNYYGELRRRLRKVARFIEREYRGNCAVYVNGPIAEKPLAQRSGLGFYGKHSVIINPRFGSWCVIGEIVTDLSFAADRPLLDSCGTCRICMSRCPTRAILRSYVLDRRICIQALTNWIGLIPDRIAKVWGNRVYGCTVCQDACPKNIDRKPGRPETEIGVVGQWLPVLELLDLSEDEYRARYSNNQVSAGWINFPAIRRNCLIVLGNSRDPKVLPVVDQYLKDVDQNLAATARWARQRIKRG